MGDDIFSQLPAIFRQPLESDTPNPDASAGTLALDLIGIKYDRQMDDATSDEVFYTLHHSLGIKNFPSSTAAALKALGISTDISHTERHYCGNCSNYVYPPPDFSDPLAPNFATQEGRRRLHGCGACPFMPDVPSLGRVCMPPIC